MEVEKRSSKAGFLQLFDWNGKSRKKLFSNKPDIPGKLLLHVFLYLTVKYYGNGFVCLVLMFMVSCHTESSKQGKENLDDLALSRLQQVQFTLLLQTLIWP